MMPTIHSRLACEPIQLRESQLPYYRAIASKARYTIRPRQKREPVEYKGLPPELWLHVFSFLRGDKLDLTSLTMASKSFAALAQPLLFQYIIIRPVCGQHPTSGRLTCRRDYLERITERMQFGTQERIAHAVTTVEFSPTIDYARRESSSTEIAAVADMVARMLPLFPRLRSFRCAHLILQPQHVYTISGMAYLRSFHATNCHLSDHFHDHTYESPMEEFTMSWQGNTADLLGVTLSPHSHQRWFSFMHPDRLRTLNLAPLDAFLDRMLSDLLDRGIYFHVLRSLSLPWMAVRSESFVLLLERAPFVQELRFTVRPFHRTITMTHPLPHHVLQNLSVLEAPECALPFLLESKSLRELSCTTLRDGGSLPTDIVAIFDALPPGTFWELGKLSLDMKCLSDELLDCLTRKVPHITILNLNVRGMAWGPTPGSLGSHTTESTVAFFLSLQLPNALEYLYIGKQYVTDIRPAVRQLNEDDVLVLRSHFPFNYPSLKEAHFYAASLRMVYDKGNVTTITRAKLQRV
ncbi:hypothetical protein BDM02DRAFT_783540 [Thelephora ganbajun]|uniref:Uncharacterized protein n=1 Tax=Thelephora ganbajun TaxID=370292 RepID=A0ACB6ZPU8_THEGA|nr:hypothetical protein BDM02DRAFT_783540 [Thelephora ganbajun]